VTQTKLTPKQLLDRTRSLTADLLRYDLNNLTPAQSIRLDRAAALRLELDDISSRQLAGLPVDMAKFVVASEALERMLGGNPDQQYDNRHDFSGAKQELLRFLDDRAKTQERKAKRLAAASNKLEGSDSVPSIHEHHQQQAANGEDEQLAPHESSALTRPLPEPSAAAVPALRRPAPLPPPVAETPSERIARINGGTAVPPSPWRPSPTTQSYFASAPGNTGFRGFDVPKDF
jgi:hypothetical protein